MPPTHQQRPLELLARLGYGARGVVYALVGGLALMAALGSGGQTGGSRSALQTLLERPAGALILGLIALGLLGFAVWRVLEGLTDADRRGREPKALAVRAAHVLSGLIYGSLALTAARLALGSGGRSGSEDQAARDWTAWLLDKPFGQWLVALAGLAVIGVGVSYLLRAWRARVAEHMALGGARSWAIPLGRLGFAARGVVFLLVGGFLVAAGWRGNSGEVKGLGGALRVLQDQPYGWALLGLTAAGLLAFGLYGLVQAWYRRIDAPRLDETGPRMARELRQMGR